MHDASDDDGGLISGINVTPLVDVTLVLLVVFMVTAKMLVSQAVVLDLPEASRPTATHVVFGVEIWADGSITVDGRPVPGALGITSLARDARDDDSEVRAVIRADANVRHGRVIEVVDSLQAGGIHRIAFAVVPKANRLAEER